MVMLLDFLLELHKAVMRDAPYVWEKQVRKSSTRERAWLDKHLNDPDYQRAARIKIWREIGIELDEAKGRTIKTPQGIQSEGTEMAALQ
jgi:hypothetical protein